MNVAEWLIATWPAKTLPPDSHKSHAFPIFLVAHIIHAITSWSTARKLLGVQPATLRIIGVPIATRRMNGLTILRDTWTLVSTQLGIGETAAK